MAATPAALFTDEAVEDTSKEELLARLKRAGVHLRLRDGGLVAGPQAAVNKELQALIKRNKATLFEVVKDSGGAWPARENASDASARSFDDELRRLIDALFATDSPEAREKELTLAKESPEEALRCFRALLAGRMPMRKELNDLIASADKDLEARPDALLAVASDDAAISEGALIAVVRRGEFACLLHVDKAKYDGGTLLEVVERHASARLSSQGNMEEV